MAGTERQVGIADHEIAIDTSIPADPNVKNYSYAIVDGQVYYRENSRMVKPELNATAAERVKGMVSLRDCVNELIVPELCLLLLEQPLYLEQVMLVVS